VTGTEQPIPEWKVQFEKYKVVSPLAETEVYAARHPTEPSLTSVVATPVPFAQLKGTRADYISYRKLLARPVVEDLGFSWEDVDTICELAYSAIQSNLSNLSKQQIFEKMYRYIRRYQQDLAAKVQ
jgi:hypothetical protein